MIEILSFDKSNILEYNCITLWKYGDDEMSISIDIELNETSFVFLAVQLKTHNGYKNKTNYT